MSNAQPSLRPSATNKTLWHELAHVAQYVREGGDHERFKEAEFKIPYSQRPCEVEARAIAKRYGDIPLLTSGEPTTRTWAIN